MTEFVFNSVPNCRIGSGSVNELSDVFAHLDIRKPLVVTDQGIIACGLLSTPLQTLKTKGFSASVFDAVLADPPEQNVMDAVQLGLADGCDGVIGFGGGSSMDVAKLVAILLRGEQPLQEMYGVDQVTGQRLPLIQVPTTAGTGSEATAVAIITTGESTKAGVVSPKLFADCAVLDPDLTIGLPPHVTAATGIDAMVHAIEAYTSVRLKNPLSDMVALQALRLLSANLLEVVENGSNLDARANMLLGAMLAGQAFANAPVAAVHALAYPLGGQYHIPHGLSNSLMLPHVLQFNAQNCAPLYVELAAAIHGVDATSVEQSNVGEVLAKHFADLAKQCGLQTSLREMQIPGDDLPKLAGLAMEQQRLLINNPRDVEYDDALNLYQAAF